MKLKKYFGLSEDIAIYYRPGTSDEGVLDTIINKKEDYIFPHMGDANMCFDIGANIGVASLVMATVYPNATIHAFEPEPENFSILMMNIEHYPNIFAHGYGLGASAGKKNLWPSDDPLNKGGFSNFIEHGEPTIVEIASVRQTVAALGVPDIVKIDVEGAECEILRNFPDIKKVRWITGELHGEDSEYLLLQRLSSSFLLQHARGFGSKVWHFHAMNKAWKKELENAAVPPEK